jgi:two-component sensor histidine kinase
MGSSYGLVSREKWTEVSLRELIAEQIKPHQLGDDERIEIEGPDIHIKPASALALGLVIHEFTTNAVKHGSLSQPDGRVLISWSVEHASLPLLALQWTESGGPPASNPTRKGFGTTLIERELKHTLGGSAQFNYGDDGFEAKISLPFDSKVMSLGPSGPQRPPTAGRSRD